MPAMETNLEELLGIIARNAIVIQRQDKALTDLSTMYNEKSAECERLQKELDTLKLIEKEPLGN